MSDRTLPSSLSAAKAAGATHYFTGRPCRRGHLAPRSANNAACVVCHSERLKQWGRSNPAARRATCNKYEKTKRGFLMRIYRNMQSRVDGVQKKKHHLYAGKSLLPRADFYAWALASERFHELFAAYEASQFDRKLAPSADRVDSGAGYEIDNMEWVTHAENSLRGTQSRWASRRS